MALSNASFTSQRAPCGQNVDGESYRDQDEDVMVTEELDYACGCRTIRHEYHDGSVSSKVVRHDGTVLVDELLSAE
jgi:membrane-bound inhibitor of C-type lysozyme